MHQFGFSSQQMNLIHRTVEGIESGSICSDEVVEDGHFGFLLDYDIPEVNAARMKVNLVPALENLEIEAMEVSNKRDKLLDVLCREMEQ